MKKAAKKPVKQGVKKVVDKAMKLKKLIKLKTIAKLIKSSKIKSAKKSSKLKSKVNLKAKKAAVKPKAKKIIAKPKTKVAPKKSKTSASTPAKKIIAKRLPVIKRKKSEVAVGPIDVKPYHTKAGEEYMNLSQLKHFSNILLQWKEQLLQEAETTKQDIQATSANFPDPVDRASLEEEFSLELRARDRERKLIKKIEETLQRIKEKSYGYCDDCGAEIGIRRLEARPTAAQCIECKTVSELKEKQVGEIGREEE